MYSKGNNPQREKDYHQRKIVLHTISKLNIPIIEINREVFVPHPYPLSISPFRLDVPYIADG